MGELAIESIVETVSQQAEIAKIRVPKDGVLAAIVLITDENNHVVLSIGTGTRCLPAQQLLEHYDDLVHDSHAEVLARRAFIRFALQEALLKKQGSDSILWGNSDRFSELCLKAGSKLCLLTTRAPCKRQAC
jgi:tRNA-specific adenosine deaminase 1